MGISYESKVNKPKSCQCVPGRSVDLSCSRRLRFVGAFVVGESRLLPGYVMEEQGYAIRPGGVAVYLFAGSSVDEIAQSFHIAVSIFVEHIHTLGGWVTQIPPIPLFSR